MGIIEALKEESTIMDSSHTLNGPRSTVEDILACQISRWYETFRSLPKDMYSRKSVTIKSVILPLPSSFIEYLISDGVRLPEDATKVSSFFPTYSNDDDDGDSWGDNEEENDDGDEEGRRFAFPELTGQIQSAIDFLGGAVIPKLNWSSPKDATWINGGTLKCQTPGDVYMLLKSSDFVMHDVLHVFDNTIMVDAATETSNHTTLPEVTYELTLRQWCNLNPSMEFRCFVWNGEMLAISQRHHSQHFPHLSPDKMILRSLLLEFYDDFIHENFSGQGNFCFDVYMDKDKKIWLIDFNVWGSQTDSLLFTWDELISMSGTASSELADDLLLANKDPEIRVVETGNEIHHDPLASYRAPIDTVDLASMSSPDVSNFQDFMSMCAKPSNTENKQVPEP